MEFNPSFRQTRNARPEGESAAAAAANACGYKAAIVARVFSSFGRRPVKSFMTAIVRHSMTSVHQVFPCKVFTPYTDLAKLLILKRIR